MNPTTPTQSTGESPRRQGGASRPGQNEGSAMLVTMLMLLMATAAGMFGVHAASFEIRAAGAQRQRLQAQYVGETGIIAARAYVDVDPARIDVAMTRGMSSPPQMAPFEPALATGKRGYRIYLEDFAAELSNTPVDQEAVGVHSAHAPQLIVDINDDHTPPNPIAGQNAARPGHLRHIRWTFTSRGRLQVRSTIGDITIAGDTRQFHEGASDARSQIISGPVSN